MNLGEVLALGPTCELCGKAVRQLYPLTHHDGKHWVPVRACVACCGPAGFDDVARSVRLDLRLPTRR